MNAITDTGPVSTRAPRWLLLAGLVAGGVLAAAGLASAPVSSGLPTEAAARVGSRLILHEEWQRAIAAVASDRRTPLTDADRRHVLERLVDEELLVQHGVALGLVETDARLRSTLVSQVMQVAAGAAREPPDEAALRAFHATHGERFAPAARLRVRAWRIAADGSRAPFTPAVPEVLLPPAKLQAYLGPALTQRALALAPGETSEPLVPPGPGGDAPGRVVLELLESQPAAVPPFEQAREQVRAEARRAADEAAVRALLARLREERDIVIGSDPS